MFIIIKLFYIIKKYKIKCSYKDKYTMCYKI